MEEWVLGLLGAANKALLAKWLWRFKFEEDKLWARCIMAIHKNRRTTHDPQVKKSSSGPWKSIIKNRDDIIAMDD